MRTVINLGQMLSSKAIEALGGHDVVTEHHFPQTFKMGIGINLACQLDQAVAIAHLIHNNAPDSEVLFIMPGMGSAAIVFLAGISGVLGVMPKVIIMASTENDGFMPSEIIDLQKEKLYHRLGRDGNAVSRS